MFRLDKKAKCWWVICQVTDFYRALNQHFSKKNSHLRDFLFTFLHCESCKTLRQLTKQSTTEANLSISQALPCASFRDNIILNSLWSICFPLVSLQSNNESPVVRNVIHNLHNFYRPLDTQATSQKYRFLGNCIASLL